MMDFIAQLSFITYFSILAFLLILICILASKIESLKKENMMLKEKLNTLNNGHNNIISSPEAQVMNQFPNIINSPENISQHDICFNKKIVSKNDRKNTAILVAGASLIVLAAIIFLLSSWNTIEDVVKTSILGLLIGVFIGASSIAKKVFKLDQASKTFYYISMAYMPIVLFSISIFGLFGEYLSITGLGKFIFLSTSSLLLSLLYIFEFIRTKRKPLIIFSLLFQILTVIFVVLSFSNSFNNVILGLLVYLLIIGILSNRINLIKLGLENFRIIIPILLLATTAITVSSTIIDILLANCSSIDVINYILLSINYYIVHNNYKYFKIFLNIGILTSILALINLSVVHMSYESKLLIISVATVYLYAINYFISKKIRYKVVAYIALNFFGISILKIIGMSNYLKYVPVVTTIISILIEKLHKDEKVKYYIVISFIVSFIALNTELSVSTLIVLLLQTMIFNKYIKSENLNNSLIIIPLVAIIPSIYSQKNYLSENIMQIMSFILIIYITIKSLLQKKANINTCFSILYIVLNIFRYKINDYFSICLVLTWSLLHSFIFEKKDVFKTISYIMVLALYQKAIKDLKLTDITLIRLVGYLTCLYTITRTILKKHTDAYKAIEYIVSAIIFIVAISTYSGITDAMIFITFLLVLIILGYIRKLGPIFLTSLIAIVINLFKLTLAFWVSIPWWVYIVCIGISLIVFAIRNEVKEKKEPNTLNHNIKRFKEKYDL